MTAALKLRNQTNMVIGYHLGPSADLARSGEDHLIGMLAPTCRTFIDVGANVGDWSAAFISAAPRAQGLLFEPSYGASVRLKQRFRNMSTVEIVEAAVGNCHGSMPFYEEPGAGVRSSLIASEGGDRVRKRSVTVTTIDTELAKRGWEGVDFLKVDAEGYDSKVLQGASSLIRERRVRLIQFEYNSTWAAAGDTLAKAIKTLEGNKYSVYLVRPEGLFSFDYGRYGEYYSYSNYLAVSPDSIAHVSSMLKGWI